MSGRTRVCGEPAAWDHPTGAARSSVREVAFDRVERVGAALGAREDEGALERGQHHGRVLVCDGRRSSELDVDVGDRGLPPGEQIVDVHAELVVVGGVDDCCGEGTAQREVVVDEKASPGCQDQADRFGNVSASVSLRSSSSLRSARATSIASLMSCVLPPGK